MAVAEGFEEAVPLIQYANSLPEGSGERAFIETFTAESDVMAALPMRRPNMTGKHRFTRTAMLPSVQFRGYNEEGNVSHGKTTKFEEGVFLMDEYIQVDRAEVDELGATGRARQERMKTTAMSRHFTDTLLKGDTVTEPREPTGLQGRFTEADKTLFHNSNAAGGAPLDLSQLDIAIAAVNKATHIICSRNMLPFWMAAARSPTLTNTTIVIDKTDPLGRVDMRGNPMPAISYQGLPFLWGYEPDDGDAILPFNEVGAGGGAAVTTSLYVVSFMDERVFGIEGQALSVRDEGQIPGKPFLSTHVKWDWGLVTEHPRSGARLTSVASGAITST